MYKTTYENLSDKATNININIRKFLVDAINKKGLYHVIRLEITSINREENSVEVTCWVEEKDCSESMTCKFSKNILIRKDLVEG